MTRGPLALVLFDMEIPRSMLTVRRLLLGSMLAALASAVGCDGLLNPACTLELGSELSPTSRTLTLGESLTPRGTIVTCGGRDREPARLILSIPDSSVVVLRDNATSVRAVGAGSVQVEATDARYGPLGFIAITVVTRE